MINVYRILAVALSATLLAQTSSAQIQGMSEVPDVGKSPDWVIAIHGGAGSASRADLSADAVMELAADTKRVGSHVDALKKAVVAQSAAHLDALDAHMRQRAAFWNVGPVKVEWSELEKKASKVVPRPTALVKQNGYRGYSEFMDAVPADKKKEFPYNRRSVGNTRELNLLINGKNSVLDIKSLLDAQTQTTSELEAIFNYLEILKLAGLIEF